MTAIEWLARTVWGEARGEGVEGMRAVAHVIMNRVNDSRFPDTVCGVIGEGQAEGKCQFSYRCGKDVTDIKWPGLHVTAGETAEAVLVGEAKDPTDGALFFHAASIPAGWFATRDRVGNFGGNIFYR